MGWLPSPPGSYSIGSPPGLKAQQVLPQLVDLSWGEPPVGDQGKLSSCTAWATSYYYKTFQEYKEHWWSLTSANHQFSPSFVYNQTNYGVDNGANLSNVFSLIQSKGDDTWAVFPIHDPLYLAADRRTAAGCPALQGSRLWYLFLAFALVVWLLQQRHHYSQTTLG